MLETSQRCLLNNGISIVSTEEAQNQIIKHGKLPDHIKVRKSPDAEKYELLYQETIIHDGTEGVIVPKYSYTIEQQENFIEFLLTLKRDNTDKEIHEKRVAYELTFFIEYEKVDFLCSLKDLIEEFKEQGVIWGVGRGSSCASYILYLLEVHDINPITYEIDFKEFSKWEQDE